MFNLLGYFKYLLVGAVALSVWLILLEVISRKKGKQMKKYDLILRWCMGEYLVLLFAITVSPVYGWSFPHIVGNINLTPFEVFSSIQSGSINFFGNILLFIPVGILLHLLFGKKERFWKILWGTAVSCLIELLQLFTTRGTDIDDVLLNTFGTIIGWIIVSVSLMYMSSKKGKTQTSNYSLNKSKIGVLICISLSAVMLVGFSISDSFDSFQDQYSQAGIQNQSMQRATDSTYQSSNVINNKKINLTAKNGILISTDTNKILWEKNSHEYIAPASCAKLLNALTVLKYSDPDEIFKVGKEINMIPADASRSYLSIGAHLTVRQAIIAMLLPSGNDAAYSLAVFTGKRIASDQNLSNEEAIKIFEREMNSTAHDIGASESYFNSPDGYDTDGQYTTAYDLAIIGERALENDLIADIVKMPHSEEVWASGETAEYDNTNDMLHQDCPYYVPECTGLKTGTSTEAGACLVMSFATGNKNYVGVIMGSTEDMRFEDAVQLYNLI